MSIITLDLSRRTRTFDGGYILYPPNRAVKISELVELGNYDEGPGWFDDKRFQYRGSRFTRPRVVKLVDMRQFGFADYYEWGDGYNDSDAFKVLAHMGLERPTYEDALLFGWQHPEVQLAQSLLFLHERWCGTGYKDFDGLVSELGRFERSDGSKGRKLTMTDADCFYGADIVVGVVSQSLKASSEPFRLPPRRQIIFIGF